MTKLNWKRVSAGWYSAIDRNGVEFDVICHTVYGGKSSHWNLRINGACDDAYATKREAVESANRIANEPC